MIPLISAIIGVIGAVTLKAMNDGTDKSFGKVFGENCSSILLYPEKSSIEIRCPTYYNSIENIKITTINKKSDFFLLVKGKYNGLKKKYLLNNISQDDVNNMRYHIDFTMNEFGILVIQIPVKTFDSKISVKLEE